MEERKDNLETTGSEDCASSSSALSSSSREEKIDIDKFKSIESIAFYLQGHYGFETFKRIYDIVAVTDSRARGRVLLSKYIEELKGYLVPAQVEKHLVLFLALCRIRG